MIPRGVELRAYVAAYLMEGMALVPVAARSKRPVLPAWQAAPVRDWQDWPAGDRLNVGVHLGASGLAAVDVDGPGAAVTLAQLLDVPPAALPIRLLELGAAGIVHRGTPGRFQAIYRAPEGRELRRLYLADDLELRAGPSQSLMPPSVHPTGAPYEFVGGRFDLAGAGAYPSALLAREAPDPAARRPRLRAVPPPAGLDPDGIESIAPPAYFKALLGADVPARGGMIRCPLPGHDDRTPSCSVDSDAGRGWHCFGCGRGGGIYELAAHRAGLPVPLRGRDFLDVRDAVRRALGIPDTASRRAAP